MKRIGLICEYNPFHNGHIHHLQEARKICGDGIVIAVLSGYFSMRGDICVINKYDKVKTAINHGVNITLELPYLLSTQNADIFAYNSVKTLDLIGIDEIVAGSETTDLKMIEKAYNLTKNVEFNNSIKELLDKGFSYPKSFADALLKHNIKLNSNDILNLKYYEAIQEINPNIKLTLIKRINNNYSDKELNDSNIQSATAIRLNDNIEKYVPKCINDIKIEKGFYDINEFSNILKHLILTQDLSNTFQAKEGIENSFKTNFNSIDELVNKLTNKRYTSSRIKRFISYILTNTKKDEIMDQNVLVRVTGFDDKGQKYLSSIKKETNYFTRLVTGINNIYDKELQIAHIFSNTYNEDFIKIEQKLPYIAKKDGN
jgi:predicted nucleotidyltransferase